MFKKFLSQCCGITTSTFAAVSLLLLSTLVHGQHTLSGVVRDAETNETLISATVHLQAPERYTLTDAMGRFTISNVPGGSLTLVFTYIGYEARERIIAVPSSSDVEIRLEPSAIMTEAVVVQATRATGKTPTTFTNISKEKIEAQNFGQDVPFLLNWTPSVVTTSDAGTGIGYTGIRIRGSDPFRCVSPG